MKLHTTTKIIATSVAALVIIFSLTGYYAWHLQKHHTLQRLEKSLLDQTRLCASFFEQQSLEAFDRPSLQQLLEKLGRGGHIRMTIISKSGEVLADSEKTLEDLKDVDNHKSRPEVLRAFSGSEATSQRFSTTVNRPMLYAAVPLYAEGEIIAVIRLAMRQSEIHETLEGILHPMVVGLSAGVLFFSAFWIFVFRNFGSHIVSIQNLAHRYSKGDFSKKIPHGKFEELNALSSVMNRMAVSLQSRMAETEKERHKMSAMLTSMQEGVMAVGMEMDVLLANPSACRLFGCDESSCNGKSLLELSRSQKLEELAREAIQKGNHTAGEIEIPYPLERILKVNAVGIAQTAGEMCGLLVFHDITELRTLENVRTEFVANVSHELKTPLTSIKGFIETLLSGALKDPQKSKEFLQIMEQDCDRLTRLIHELLDLSNIESGNLQLQFQVLTLEQVFKEVLAGFSARLTENGLTLQQEIKNPHLRVMADADKLHQILTNLIDNAIKFNRPGGAITLRAFPEGKMILFEVSDTGYGIPDNLTERIFERFFRVDKARSRELGGTGLGLSIVKHLVESHGGTVSCQSELGTGSTFLFTIPAA